MRIPAFNTATALLAAAAIADRGLLGVATLATTILIGRWAGPAELGLFSLFFPMLFAAIALQESIITAPYTIFAAECGEEGGRRRYLGSVVVHTVILAALCAGVFVVAAGLLQLADQNSYAAVAAVLAPVVPCVLLREFARRVVYADLTPQVAVLISGGASAMQLALMAAFHFAGILTAGSAFFAMGLSSLAVGAAWLVASRRQLEFAASSLKPALSRNWRLGRWIAAAQVGDVVRVHMFPWLLALTLDDGSVGIYAACAAIAGLSGPLQIAISNLLLPQLATAEARGGLAAADRLMWQATGWLVVAMTIFTLAIGSVSGQIVPWLYGSAYAGSQAPLVLLLIAHLVVGVSLPAARALVALKRPELDFITHVLGIGVNVAVGLPLVLWWGVAGAAAASLVGAAAKAVLTATFYSRELRANLFRGLMLPPGDLAGLPPQRSAATPDPMAAPRVALAAAGAAAWGEDAS